MRIILVLLAIVIIHAESFSQAAVDTIYRKHFAMTSLWSIANFFPDPGDFYELNYGYRFTAKDAIIINATTWKYPEPLGIPIGNEHKYAHTKEYPGFVRAFGLGLAYQRFVWKKVYGSAHANGFLQNFYDEQDKKIQRGFQLYLQFRVGYRITLFNQRLFLDPAISFNHWPVNTNFPEDFEKVEREWNNYFLWEPHLNIGFYF